MKSWFPISILTDEVSQDLGAVIRFAQEFQLDGIELRSLHGKAFRDLSPAEIAEVRQRCDDAGLRVSGVATPVFKCRLDAPEEIREHVELFKRSVDAAHVLGCKIVRVFAFLRESHPATSAELERAAAQFPALIDAARGTGATVGIENEASCIVGSGRETAEFLSHLEGAQPLEVVWDPCNVLYLDDAAADPVQAEFLPIAARVAHVHVKDARREGTRAARECVELGTGDIDFPAQFQLLRKWGYHRWVTLETHWRGARALDPESQHLPSGYAFSAGAEAASRICMAHLQRMLAKAA